MSAGAAALIAGWNSAATPPPNMSVSEWADEHRRLPETSAAQGARWRTSTTPYLAGIMDAALDPRVSKIAVMKSAQSGGSEAISNIIGYHIEHDPCPILVVHPTAGAAEAWSKERLSDMIRTTPALSRVVRDKRQPKGSHEAESTVGLKMFAGGYLAVGGANTPNTFARWSARIAIGDDVDRFPPVVGDEGDPADLLVNRTTTFYNKLAIFVSTPTLKKGRIDTLYTRSDQRRYVVPCLECGNEDWITWNDPTHFSVGFEDRDPSTARLVCPACGCHFGERHRRDMVLRGRWAATRESDEIGLVGFHLPAMISTLGITMAGLVDKWLAAREKGKESLRVFLNTQLAEAWEERGTKMDPHALTARKEDYGDDVEVPAWAAALTAGVDVQENRFELQVLGWGLAGERCVVDYRVVPGDPKSQETRAALLEALGRRYQHALGVQLPIHATCIDSGYATDEVYDFVLAYQSRQIFATKGWAGKTGEPIVGKPSGKKYGRRSRPVPLYPINVDDAKADVMGSLTVSAPGPGYMHFPAHLDSVSEEYFAQLCAEHRETRYNKGGVATHTVWVQDRERNEALDTAVLALAAYRLRNPNIRQMLASIEAQASVPVPAADRSPTSGGDGPALPPRPRRRVARSPYLSR